MHFSQQPLRVATEKVVIQNHKSEVKKIGKADFL
jgi:hypothetical protein